jgi:hypothetical protein
MRLAMGRVYAVSPIGSPSRSGRSVVEPRMQATIHLRRRLLLARLQFERRRLARPRYLRDRRAPGSGCHCAGAVSGLRYLRGQRSQASPSRQGTRARAEKLSGGGQGRRSPRDTRRRRAQGLTPAHCEFERPSSGRCCIKGRWSSSSTPEERRVLSDQLRNLRSHEIVILSTKLQVHLGSCVDPARKPLRLLNPLRLTQKA